MIDGWEDTIEDLDARLSNLPTHPGARYVSDSVAELLARTRSVWSMSAPRLKTARESLALLIADDSIHDFRKIGLIKLAAFLEEEEETAALQSRVNELIQDVGLFDQSARDLVVGNLQNVSSAVAIQAETIRTNRPPRCTAVGCGSRRRGVRVRIPFRPESLPSRV